MGVSLTPRDYECQPKKFHTAGELDGERVYQSFSRGNRNHNFYLTTVQTKEGGGVDIVRISPTAAKDHTEAIEQSLYMKKFIAFCLDRVIDTSKNTEADTKAEVVEQLQLAV